MPDANDILTAEQVLALFRNEDVSWMEVAARLEISHKRLREQLDEAEDITNAMVERFAQVVGAFVETELARAHRSEARLARVTTALEAFPTGIEFTDEQAGALSEFVMARHDALAVVEDERRNDGQEPAE